jgi:hypothetical protein
VSISDARFDEAIPELVRSIVPDATALPASASDTLAPLLDAAKARADGKLVISGFHDKTGERPYDVLL